jgi:hypothetical protein
MLIIKALLSVNHTDILGMVHDNGVKVVSLGVGEGQHPHFLAFQHTVACASRMLRVSSA